MSLPVFDTHDRRIRYFVLRLQGDIRSVPVSPLPKGYHFAFYQPGDRETWIDIQRSAKEFSTYDQGLEGWNRYYQDKDEFLSTRMVFVVNERGEKVATATAYDADIPQTGRLHWVAIRREEQGKGLSKPMLSRVFEIMRGLGYIQCLINTQTTTWLALKVYMDLGFWPTEDSLTKESPQGWRIIKRLTNHPTLRDIEAAGDEEMLAEK